MYCLIELIEEEVRAGDSDVKQRGKNQSKPKETCTSENGM